MAAKSILIGYDLNNPRQNNDYKDLIEKIKTLSATRWHCLDSTWIIKSDATCVQVRDALTPFLDSGDELLVVELTGSGAWKGFDDNCSKWLKNNV